MAPRRRGWWARRLSGRGIGRVLSSPPSDGRHGATEWPPTSALSVRIASANTWADMVGTGPEAALQRWSVRRPVSVSNPAQNANRSAFHPKGQAW
jgi:hypothetical protein